MKTQIRKIGLFITLAIIVTLSLMAFIIIHPQKRVDDVNNAVSKAKKKTSIFETALLKLELQNSSQTVSSLKTADANSFDFIPHEWLYKRNRDGYYQLGDINLRIKVGENNQWTEYSTAKKRAEVDTIQLTDQTVLAAANLEKTLPADIPLSIVRYWEKDGDNLVMRFELQNKTDQPVEIGALGLPMIFDNDYDYKTLDQAHSENVFYDPYIGMDAGYLQVVRLNGEGKVLVVVPLENTPFEAYRPLIDDPTPISYTFEGFYEWMACSKAYSENEWKGVEEWNKPSSVILSPGEERSFGVKFLVAESVRDIENTLMKASRPVAMGVPGYVLPMDVDAGLFINYPEKVESIVVEPERALKIKSTEDTKHGWKTYKVKGEKWGRSRLTIKYADGTFQTVNYKIIKSESEVVADYGNFLINKQWFNKPNDIFHRSPSVISYDYELKKQVTQDARVWVAGLGDEAGAGSWLGAIMKQVVEPEKEEVAKLEDFVNQTIWGGLQYNKGEHKYGVRKSMFYYEPDSMPAGTYSDEIQWGAYGGFPSWDKEEAESVGRSYNYPHVAAAHWAMYRLARYHKGYVSQQNWRWYLENAAQTVLAMVNQGNDYAEKGLMEGSVFILILNDLYAEGLTDMATELKAAMKARMDHWSTLKYPFGSEMAWDSTGQEEVYMWAKYFGFDDKALVTLNAILAYMPTVPHWGYNGNARRFWDFKFAGKLMRFERMIHHYGSALNAIPVLNQYREYPADFYLLRVGYGGLLGAISNITQDGFAPCAFHSYPSTLRIDYLTGDYGTGFYGYAVNTSSYLLHHDEFGWLAFGGNNSQKGDWVTMELTTAAKNRVFIAPVGLWLTLDAGQFKSVSYNEKSGEVKLEFEKADEFTPEAYLHVSTPASELSNKKYDTSALKKNELDAFVIQLENKPVSISLELKK